MAIYPCILSIPYLNPGLVQNAAFHIEAYYHYKVLSLNLSHANVYLICL